MNRSRQAIWNRCQVLGITWFQGTNSLYKAAKATGWSVRYTLKVAKRILPEMKTLGKGQGTRYTLTNDEYGRLIVILRRSRTYKPWSAEEDAKLIKLFNKGTRLRVAAFSLNRSYGAVKRRIVVLRKQEKIGFFNEPHRYNKSER